MKQLDIKPQAYVKKLVCDRCAREADHEDFEFFEFLSFANKGGYGSVFGDGNEIEIDLCQHCIKEILGPWLRNRPEGWQQAALDQFKSKSLRLEKKLAAGARQTSGIQMGDALAKIGRTLRLNDAEQHPTVPAGFEQPVTAERLRHVHETEDYNKWFRAQVAEAIKEADAPDAQWVSDADAKKSWETKRAGLLKRAGGDMTLVWGQRAIKDRDIQIDYIAAQSKSNPMEAVLQSARIAEQIELLQQNPQMGRPGRKQGTYELDINCTLLTVVYRIKGKRIELLRVLHGGQEGVLGK